LGALSTLCGYTVVSPVAQIMPLIIVLSVTAIKDAYGDIVIHPQLINKHNNYIKTNLYI